MPDDAVEVEFVFTPARPVEYIVARFRITKRVAYVWTRKGRRRTRRLAGQVALTPAEAARFARSMDDGR